MWAKCDKMSRKIAKIERKFMICTQNLHLEGFISVDGTFLYTLNTSLLDFDTKTFHFLKNINYQPFKNVGLSTSRHVDNMSKCHQISSFNKISNYEMK